MAKVILPPPLTISRERHRFSGGIAFLVLLVVSLAIWAALIALIF